MPIEGIAIKELSPDTGLNLFLNAESNSNKRESLKLFAYASLFLEEEVKRTRDAVLVRMLDLL